MGHVKLDPSETASQDVTTSAILPHAICAAAETLVRPIMDTR